MDSKEKNNLDTKKLPNLTLLHAEYEQLQAQKEALYADYG